MKCLRTNTLSKENESVREGSCSKQVWLKELKWFGSMDRISGVRLTKWLCTRNGGKTKEEQNERGFELLGPADAGGAWDKGNWALSYTGADVLSVGWTMTYEVVMRNNGKVCGAWLRIWGSGYMTIERWCKQMRLFFMCLSQPCYVGNCQLVWIIEIFFTVLGLAVTNGLCTEWQAWKEETVACGCAERGSWWDVGSLLCGGEYERLYRL